jgi:hypothetical protein
MRWRIATAGRGRFLPPRWGAGPIIIIIIIIKLPN